jgi:hypothetical protein
MKRFNRFTFKKLILLFTFGIIFLYAFPASITIHAQQSPPIIGIKITSPSTGQQVPVGHLTISGISTDNATTDCTVYADWNNLKPFQTAVATGPGGVNDYSTWSFTFTDKYHLITNGTNEITSKLSCISNPTNLTKWYSVNVIGVGTDNQTLQPIEASNDTARSLLYPIPSTKDNQYRLGARTFTISQSGIANMSTMTMTMTESQSACNKNLMISDIISFGDDGEGDDSIETNILDNNLESRWSVETIGSWIQADLGVNNVICSIDIAWYKGNARSHNFVISASADGNSYTNVYEGTSSGKTLSSERYTFKEIIARYVKITLNGNNEKGNENWGAITEIDVNGPMATDKKALPSNTVKVTIRGTYEPSSNYFSLPHEELKMDPNKLEGTLGIYNSTTNNIVEEYDLALVDVKLTDLFRTLTITTSLDHPTIFGSVNSTLNFMSPVDFQKGGNYSSNTTTANAGNILTAKIDGKIYDTKGTAVGNIFISP